MYTVTSANLGEYIARVANYRLNVEPAKACAAFVAGFNEMVITHNVDTHTRTGHIAHTAHTAHTCLQALPVQQLCGAHPMWRPYPA